MASGLVPLAITALVGSAIFVGSKGEGRIGPAAAEFHAELTPMNAGVTGLESTGAARFVVGGDKLTISVRASKVPPGIMHLQHLHGFEDGRQARCATQADDANGDGIVDLIETEVVSGITMVPLSADPASLAIMTDTYPKASSDGTYQYQQTVSLPVLQQAFARAFNGQALDLERRVVYIHGVPPSSALPASVASLGDVPAQVTLPIACGEIEAGRP
ncbi:MAG: hypothetical protein IT176_09180 [Acidobacteria bacterium]|nr:hypothetical protein [Acidobacteriota bacterium]